MNRSFSIPHRLPAVLSAVLVLALAACQGSNDPASHAANVAETEREAAEDVRQARDDSRQRITEAHEDARSEQRTMQEDAQDVQNDVRRAEIQARYDQRVVEIDAAADVEKERCRALEGDAQDDCVDRAESTRDTALEQLERETELWRDQNVPHLDR